MTDREYIIEIKSHSDFEDFTYQQIADMTNEKYKTDYWHSERVRDVWRKYKKKNNKVENILPQEDSNLIDLKKERIRLQDQRNLLNKVIRETARYDNLIDTIIECANVVAKEKPLVNVNPIFKRTTKSAISLWSDWHFGLAISNFLNDYNVDKFKQRINQLVKETIEKCKFYDVDELHIVLLGDNISGNIRNVIRMQNQVDVISQTQIVSETLAEMLQELSKYFRIEVYSCLDNHSRVTALKDDSLDAENFGRIQEWYLKARLKDNKNVNFNENELGYDIATFEVCGFKCAAVHGHLDNKNNIVPNITLLTRDIYDFIFAAHYHHMFIEDTNKTMAIFNGTLSGNDEHAIRLRKSSYAMQKLIILDKGKKLDAICPIILD